MPTGPPDPLAGLTEDPLAALGDLLLTVDPTQLEAFASTLEPDDLALLETVLTERTALGWRTDPATMAHHLTGGDFRLWAYIRLLSRKFVEGIRGDDPRQVWNLPSQMGKSTLLCTWGVPWALQHNPRLRIMYVTYDSDKAVEEGGKARDVIEEHGAALGLTLRRDRRARAMWRTAEGGGLYAVGIHGGIVGWPADVVLLDDLLKGWQAAHSEAERTAVWAIYQSQVRLRLQGRQCPIIHATTRWHADDPTGRMLDPPDVVGAEHWTLIRLPALAEEHDPASHDPLLHDPDPLGRAPGEPLEPERFDLEEVLARGATLGPYLRAGLEQQRPSPEEGNELLRAWFRLEETLPPKADQAISSWDLKLKDREAGDFVVGQVWWRVAGGYWLMDQIRGQFDHATTANAIALLAVRHPEVRQHVVEAAGSADEVLPKLRQADPDYEVTDEMASRLGMNEEDRALVQALRRRGMSGLLPHPPKMAKPIRARVYIAPLAEAGDVHLPAAATWVPHLLDEVASFPDGGHDDQVDAMSQALQRMSKSGGASVKAAQGTLPAPAPGQSSGVKPAGVPAVRRASVSSARARRAAVRR